ncbi:hypothetical protein ACWT_4637 [Actinoplanes sp. SE50]|uniref:hypothetical protein n=1 Tax=unclassified Actinoplanes TaxID=2626549 RepID=UPI00023ED63D|nr:MULTISPECIES: hypothetical protein [unclassified Actinoplanes]AEV85659.1 hypothetical protein ACPL_4768 [Actinoplanes sp. SE50/110]ATO84052.1 hypothetical protein ACWT_4637 [Actinoplanes sp. SE50]SLM01462.1 hypothetical protein ACSP50_4698 [Actinoplanes sp. SE50/110]
MLRREIPVTAVLACLAAFAGTRPAYAGNEMMVERCSGDVYISSAYNDRFPPAGGIYLKRSGEAFTPWSPPMPVAGHTFIRWWCHSTTGNWLDPGTWRIDGVNAHVDCDYDSCSLGTGATRFYTFDVNGWTAERSRCGDPATAAISARLGPQRLLLIECRPY